MPRTSTSSPVRSRTCAARAWKDPVVPPMPAMQTTRASGRVDSVRVRSQGSRTVAGVGCCSSRPSPPGSSSAAIARHVPARTRSAVRSAVAVRATSRVRTVTAMRESKPRCRSTSSAPIVASPTTATTSATTRSRAARACSAGLPAGGQSPAAGSDGSPGVRPSAAATWPSSGRGRAACMTSPITDQSMWATAVSRMPAPSTEPRALRHEAGDIVCRPRDAAMALAPASTMPPPAHPPQWTTVASRPAARRPDATASSAALAAA